MSEKDKSERLGVGSFVPENDESEMKNIFEEISAEVDETFKKVEGLYGNLIEKFLPQLQGLHCVFPPCPKCDKGYLIPMSNFLNSWRCTCCKYEQSDNS